MFRTLTSAAALVACLVLTSFAAAAAAPRCAAGQVRLGARCCWPGQTLGDAGGDCVGAPKCPPALEARAAGCFPPLAPELKRLEQLLTLKPGAEPAPGSPCTAAAYSQRLARSNGCTLEVERTIHASKACVEPTLLGGGPSLTVALDRLQSIDVLCSWSKTAQRVEACLVLLTASGADETHERGTAALVADTAVAAKELAQAFASAGRACGRTPLVRELKR